MAKEIEIKIKVSDPVDLKNKIQGLGGKKLEQEGVQHDTMYDDGKGFFEGIEGKQAPKVLRLRKNPNTNKLTYKEIIPELAHEHMLNRIEIETDVPDYEVMDNILRKLGFSPYRVKEKIFENYQLDGFKVEFHKLPFLGDFIEIEAQESELSALLPKLGFSIKDGINKDYTGLFEDFCSQHGIAKETPQTFEEEKKYRQIV